LEQVILGGYYYVLDRINTRYNSLSGGFVWATSEADRYQIISTSGVIKKLRVKLSGSPGVGCRYRFTLCINGNPTALTFDIEDLAISGGDMVHGISVAGGNTVTIQSDPNNNPAARRATWTSVFESSAPKESLLLGGSYTPLNNSAIEFGQLSTTVCAYNVSESYMYQVCPTNGIIKNFYVKLSEDPGTSLDAYRFTVRVNGSDPLNGLVISIGANSTTGNDLIHIVNVSKGDLLTIKFEPLNSPSATPDAYWGATFEADIDGESIILGGTNDDLNISDTEYMTLQSGVYNLSWKAAEAERWQLAQTCTIKKLYVKLTTNPGAAKKYDFTVRIAGSGSNVTAEVSGLSTTGNSGILEDSVNLDEYLDLESDPTNGPIIADAHWGLVSYIPPPQSKDLFAKFETQATVFLKGILIIKHTATDALKAVFTIRQSSSAALKSIFIVRHSSNAQLKAVFTASRSSSATLKGISIVRYIATQDLYAVFEAQGAAYLYAKFTTQAAADLAGIFIVRHTATKDLYAKFELAQWEELRGILVTRHTTTKDLYGKLEVRHTATKHLYAKFESQATAQLKGFFVVRCCNFEEIAAGFRVTFEGWVMQGINAEVLEVLGIIT